VFVPGTSGEREDVDSDLERCIKGASQLIKAGFPGENGPLDIVMGEIDR
jgi:hypothetical protein